MALERVRRAEDAEADERHAEPEAPPLPAPHAFALRMQQTHGNRAVAQRLSRTPRTLARYDNEFTYGGSSVVVEDVKDLKSAKDAAETVIEDDLGGMESLFWQRQTGSSTSEWASLVFGLMEDRYNIVGVTSDNLKAVISELKGDYREEMLLRIARMTVYDTRPEPPYSVGNLIEQMQERGAYVEAEDKYGEVEGPDAEALQAIFDTEGTFARTQVQFDTAKNIQLLDEDNVVVIMDSHQQKHQHQNAWIPHFGTYSGGSGEQFARHKDLEWHRQNTAQTVKQTVLDAIDDGHVTAEKDYHPPKDAINGIIYDLGIKFDPPTGKWVGSYHCNPVVTE